MGNRQYLHASGATLRSVLGRSRTFSDDCQFCLATHKPGLCKGQKRGQLEPGQQDQNNLPPAQKAAVAVKGLTVAIARAQQVEARAALNNPKLAQAARKAVADYAKALRGHQQTLREAARANATNQRTAVRDTRDQDAIDRRDARQRQRVKDEAQRIKDRRAEQAKVAKMSPKQRAAYRKQKAADARVRQRIAEQKVLDQAAKS